MKRLSLSFCEINPFVRYANVSQYEKGQAVGPRKVYDHQFIYVHKGTGYMEIDGVRYEAVPGDLFFYGPSVVHTFIGSAEDPFFLSGVHFDFTHHFTGLAFPIGPFKLDYFDEALVTETAVFSDFSGFSPRINLLHDFRIGEMMRNMVTEYDCNRMYGNNVLNGTMNTLLAIVARHTDFKGHDMKVDHGTVTQVLDYIHENYHRDISNEEIADRFHFHPNYLGRLIREHTGVPIRQYIINLRIKKAVTLLAYSNKSIGQIAREVGYEDLHYFSRLVKQKTGYSPEQIKIKF